MSWRELADQSAQWDFLARQPVTSGLFLQSPTWAEVAKAHGHLVRVWGYWHEQELAGLIQLERYPLPLGQSYWFAPKGPVWSSAFGLNEQTIALTKLAPELNLPQPLFLRLEPAVPQTDWQLPPGLLRSLDINPRATTMVDLLVPETELERRMHTKTRYNIGLAERHGLQFRWAGAEEFAKFWQLLQLTAQREGFRSHTSDHYRIVLERFRLDKTHGLSARIGLVEHQGELLAASLVITCLGMATYLHGASHRAKRELMASYLLQAGAMRALKGEGITSYDLWGIQPSDGSLPTWSGFTRFKLGFGGARYEHAGTFDIPSKVGYPLYQITRWLRRAL